MHYCHVRITLPGSGRVDHMPVPKVVKFTASLVSRSHPLHISSLRLESKKLTLYYFYPALKFFKASSEGVATGCVEYKLCDQFKFAQY
jgi:hypothetical protein